MRIVRHLKRPPAFSSPSPAIAVQAEEFNAHQDPVISGINRLPARASLYSFGKELDFEFTF